MQTSRPTSDLQDFFSRSRRGSRVSGLGPLQIFGKLGAPFGNAVVRFRSVYLAPGGCGSRGSDRPTERLEKSEDAETKGILFRTRGVNKSNTGGYITV